MLLQNAVVVACRFVRYYSDDFPHPPGTSPPPSHSLTAKCRSTLSSSWREDSRRRCRWDDFTGTEKKRHMRHQIISLPIRSTEYSIAPMVLPGIPVLVSRVTSHQKNSRGKIRQGEDELVETSAAYLPVFDHCHTHDELRSSSLGFSGARPFVAANLCSLASILFLFSCSVIQRLHNFIQYS
jgi:hypothetical protein